MHVVPQKTDCENCGTATAHHHLYTGGLNALYNYHPEQDVLTTLSYSASGYGAAAVDSFTAGGGAPLWEAFRFAKPQRSFSVFRNSRC